MLKRRLTRLASAASYTRRRFADQEAANIVIIIHARSKLSRPSRPAVRIACASWCRAVWFRSFLMTSVMLIERS